MGRRPITLPQNVLSPRNRLNSKSLRIHHFHVNWSLATGIWDAQRSLLLRWNGDSDKPLGNPVSRGYPTWFVVPKELEKLVMQQISDLREREDAIAWLANEGADERIAIAASQVLLLSCES